MSIILISIISFFVIKYFFFESDSEKSSFPPKSNPASEKELAEKRHINNAMQFVKQQNRNLKNKKYEEDRWKVSYGNANARDLDKLTGIEFEDFLAGLFRQQGYEVKTTAVSGDYGADLILIKNQQRIAVQAKRYIGTVGVQAVQEVLSGKAYYECNEAWVVTTGYYTPNAKELAKKSNVKLLRRSDIGQWMGN